MKEYLTKILSAHPFIYGVVEYGRGSSRKIKVLTINYDRISDHYIDDITNVVAKELQLRKSKSGLIYFRNSSNIEDIAYLLSTRLNIKITSRRL